MQVIIFDFFGVVFNPTTKLPTAGLEDFLLQLQHHHIGCGIASSSFSETIQDFLQHHNLAHYFAIVVGINQVQTTKPDPECYLKVAEYFTVPPAECCVIDDSAAAIAGAQTIGFTTIFFGTEVDNFEEISTILKL